MTVGELIDLLQQYDTATEIGIVNIILTDGSRLRIRRDEVTTYDTASETFDRFKIGGKNAKPSFEPS